ncbi:KfrB domain-containing protein [Escherichia coli]
MRTDAGVLMKPEGSRKIAVLNGSRQIDQVLGGQWVTLKVLPEAGLPKGIYQLSDAKKPEVSSKLSTFTGQLLQVDDHKVYQLAGQKIIQHDRAVFRDLEASGAKLNVGQSITLAYQNGRGAVATGERGVANQTSKARPAGHGL